MLTLLITVVALVAHAQEITVKGTVISSADNEPMIGATVKIKGTGTGTGIFIVLGLFIDKY